MSDVKMMELENGFPLAIGIPDEPQSLITYCVCSDGIYIQKKVAKGYVVVKQELVPGITKGVEKIAIMPRKVPMSIFWETLRFFQYVEEHFGNVQMEAHVLIGYDYEKDEFILYVPKQQVGAASVTYDPNDFYTDHPGCYIVMDIHSHTSKMGAFFSGTDDHDDNRDRYSGVFGKINQKDVFGRSNPEFKIRFSSMGKRTEFKVEDLFELSDEVHTIDCENVISRVTKPVYTAPAYQGAGGYHNYYGQNKHYPNSYQGGVRVYGSGDHKSKATPGGVSAESGDAYDWEKYYEEWYGKDYADPHHVDDGGFGLAGAKKRPSRNGNRSGVQSELDFSSLSDDEPLKSWYVLLKEKRVKDRTFSISELMGE